MGHVYTGNMNVITIPKKLAQKGDLVVLPRKEYETLVRKQPKYIPVVELTASEKRIIARGEKELTRGEYVTLEDLEHELGGARAKRRS